MAKTGIEIDEMIHDLFPDKKVALNLAKVS